MSVNKGAVVIIGLLAAAGLFSFFYFAGVSEEKPALSRGRASEQGGTAGVNVEETREGGVEERGVLPAAVGEGPIPSERSAPQSMASRGERAGPAQVVGEGGVGRRSGISERQRALFRQEIAGQNRDIQIALDDIARLSEEMNRAEDALHETEGAYIKARKEYERGLINEKMLTEIREKYEQQRGHLAGLQTMLETKYRGIQDYEDRIRELEALTRR